MLTILVITRMVSSLLGFSVPEAVVNGPENILLQIGIVATAVLGPLADVVAVEVLLIVTGVATVVIAILAVIAPAGRRAIASAHAATGRSEV